MYSVGFCLRSKIYKNVNCFNYGYFLFDFLLITDQLSVLISPNLIVVSLKCDILKEKRISNTNKTKYNTKPTINIARRLHSIHVRIWQVPKMAIITYSSVTMSGVLNMCALVNHCTSLRPMNWAVYSLLLMLLCY